MVAKVLSELKPGQRGRIIKISGGGSIRRRILDMGVIKGANIEMERIAPLGDPIEVKIKGYHLSLRKEEASDIHVEIEK
jgi:Fe2+ transport system protein FeoA